MAIIDDMAWSVKEAELEDCSKFTVGKLGSKAIRSPLYMNEKNFFLKPKCKIEELYLVTNHGIHSTLMVFMKVADANYWIFPANKGFEFNALKALWAILGEDELSFFLIAFAIFLPI